MGRSKSEADPTCNGADQHGHTQVKHGHTQVTVKAWTISSPKHTNVQKPQSEARHKGNLFTKRQAKAGRKK